MPPTKQSLERAAAAWTADANRSKTFDGELAEEFARILDKALAAEAAPIRMIPAPPEHPHAQPEGHRYELLYHEIPEQPGQIVQFIDKQPNAAGEFLTIVNGTTNEAVLEMLIDRLGVMNRKLPCRENAIVLTHLETALLWLDKRTRDRKARKVENTPKA